MDLRIEGVYVKDNMNINWVCETGIIDNIGTVIKEYKETRKLLVWFLFLLSTSLYKLYSSDYLFYPIQQYI